MSGYILGAVLVFKHTLMWGNLIILSGGGLLIGFACYVAATGVISGGYTLPICLAVFGGLVLAVGGFGFLASSLASGCMLIAYSILLWCILLVLLVLGIVVLFYADSIGPELEAFCNSSTRAIRTCASLLGMHYDPATQTVYQDNNRMNITTAIAQVKSFMMGNLRMVGIIAVFLAVCAIYLAMAPWFMLCATRAARRRAATKTGENEDADILSDIASMTTAQIQARAASMGANAIVEPPLSEYYGRMQPVPEH
eukprot:GAFH01001698.1.p2 GENE.GAFH01001698.1~~GAFH01001698.1.p2  ORF type:complete len:254 (-),score=107.39 GAFH01001698.1:163-924(-)